MYGIARKGIAKKGISRRGILDGNTERFSITFDDLTDLDPYVGGDNVVWHGPSGQLAYGNEPNPLPDEVGEWFVTMASYLGCDNIKLTEDNVSSVANPCILGNMTDYQVDSNSLTEIDPTCWPELETLRCQQNLIEEVDTSKNFKLTDLLVNSQPLTSLPGLLNNPLLNRLWANSTELVSIDISAMPLLTFALLRTTATLTTLTTGSHPILANLWVNGCNLSTINFSGLTGIVNARLQNNLTLDVDTIVAQIDANKGVIPAGCKINMGGTCPAVSPASEALILVMVAAPYLYDWTRNI